MTVPAETLLRTKLYAPPPRRDLIARPRLLAKLDRALLPPTRLILVSAPAGFGKTTLVSEWLSRVEGSAAGPRPPSEHAQAVNPKSVWLTLDEADNDPVRFWRYVDAALQTLDPRLGESIRPALYTPQPPPHKTILTGLVNDILAVGLPFTLVLDDYHHIESEAVHEGVNFLVDHLPPLVHLVINTRSDPPLQLARRRGQGALCEVRAADLRFTLDEVTQLINDVLRLGLAPDDLAALESRTEGWIAGLQMAAISLQDVADPHTFVAAFRGDDRYIADYLLEEVLQHQPVEFQQFLLQTSLLDHLSGPLCDAVTGRQDSRAVLNTLERANLFVIPLDNRREWFRYHHLFASLLRQRLLDTSGDEVVRDLKRRAGGWFASHGYVVEAVEAALTCGDFEQAAVLIEQSDVRLFMGSEINTVVRWAQILPETVIAARPRLNLMVAWATHATGHALECERVIQTLEQAAGLAIDQFLDAPPAAQSLGPVLRSALVEGAVIRTSLAVNRLDLPRAFALGERVLPLLVAGSEDEPYAFNPPVRLLAALLFSLGRAHTLRADLIQAEKYLSQAEVEAERVSNLHILAAAVGHLGELQVLQGHLHQAQAVFQRALQLSQDYPPRSSAFWGLASAGLGTLAYEHNDLTAASGHLQTGLELGKLLNAWECLLPGGLGQAHVHQARGEWAQAAAVLDELIELTAADARMVRPAVEACRAWLALRQGDLASAARWVTSFDPQSAGECRLQWEQDGRVAARIWLAQGKLAEAEALLSRLLMEASIDTQGGAAIELAALQALVLEAQQRPDEARQTLRRALALAEPEGYVRLFVDEGTPMRALLADCRLPGDAASAPLAGYIEHLLAAFDPSVPAWPDHPKREDRPAQALVEPLSDRELEVLRLMAQGLSNPQIARKLYLSPNTLKAHARNIYAKLDVHNRIEAVNRARELGLLSEG